MSQERCFRETIGYKEREEDGRYVDVTTMSTARLNEWEETVVCHSVSKAIY